MEIVVVLLALAAGAAVVILSKGAKKAPATPDEKFAQLLDLLGQQDEATYLKAILILGKFDHPRSVEVLHGVLSDRRPLAASTALQVLLDVGDQNVAAELAAAMGSLADTEKIKVIELLGHRKVPGVGDDVVYPCLQHENPDVQCAAAEALGELGDRRMVEPLAHMLQHSVSFMHLACAYALARLGDPRGFPAMRLMANEDVRGIRTRLATYLGRIPTAEAQGMLMELVQDTDHFVKAKAMLALAEQRNPAVVPILIEALGDYYENVSKAAHQALVHMAGQDLGTSPAAWQRWMAQHGPDADRTPPD